MADPTPPPTSAKPHTSSPRAGRRRFRRPARLPPETDPRRDEDAGADRVVVLVAAGDRLRDRADLRASRHRRRLLFPDRRLLDGFCGQHLVLLRRLRRQRQMSHSGKGPLPASTPLLRKGDDRYAEHSLRGPLADGLDGTLALYTYEDTYYDGDGNRQTNYYRYTVGICEIPESAAHVPNALRAAQVRAEGAGEVRGRLPQRRAGRAGERGARRPLRDLRRRANRTRSGCGGSSPPPSSSG